MKLNVSVAEEERQSILLALAELSLRRPGWLDHLGRVADVFHGREMFDGFRETSADLVTVMFESNAGEAGEISIGPTSRPDDSELPTAEDVRGIFREESADLISEEQQRTDPELVRGYDESSACGGEPD